MPSSSVEWIDFVEERYDEIYERVAREGQRVSAVSNGDTLYLMPVGIFAPVGLTELEIERWLARFEDDLQVGPPFIHETYKPPTRSGDYGIIELRL